MSEDDHEVSKKKIFLFKKTYITLGALISIAVSIAGGGYHYFDLRQNNSELENQVKECREDRDNKDGELLKMKAALDQVLIEGMPVIKSPLNGANKIGTSVDLEWYSKSHSGSDEYYVEITRMDYSGETLFQEVRGKICTLILGQNIESGRHLWRVFPKEANFPRESIAFNYFTIHKTVLERIKNTKTLLIAATPSLHGPFNSYCKGKNIGFEVAFVENIIVKELEKKLGLKQGDLKHKFISTAWPNLLPGLQDKKYDMVISSMTATKTRENRYKSIKFTKGYLDTHQIFISLKENKGNLKDILKDKRVGVISKTTNEVAADYLADKFKFQVVRLEDKGDTWYDFDSFFTSLNESKIDFALVDEIYFREYLNPSQGNVSIVYQVGPYLDGELKKYYDKNYEKGRHEEYSIAVADESLLTFLNEIILENNKTLLQMKNNIQYYKCP